MDAQNILVRMPNWIGDLVMATPILTDLRTHFPKASITAMCKTPACELLKEDTAIDELFCFTKPENDFFRREEKRSIIGKIQAGKYDLGILLTHSFSSAWWFFQGKVKRRIGYSNFFRRPFLTDPIPLPQEKIHQVDAYKNILAPLRIPHSETVPRLYLTKAEVEESKQLLYQRGYIRGKKLIGVNPGAAFGSAKCWLPERFREMTQHLLQDKELFIVFFGDASGAELVKQICQGFPERVMNLAGITSLRELASLIKDLSVLVTNDSGPMHIGAALGVPLVALFGSTDAELTGPYGKKEAVIRHPVACSPCFQRKCPIDFRCMKAISVDQVIQKIHERLNRV